MVLCSECAFVDIAPFHLATSPILPHISRDRIYTSLV